MISSHLPTYFEPSSHMLLSMIARAERDFESAREQAQLRAEANSKAHEGEAE